MREWQIWFVAVSIIAIILFSNVGPAIAASLSESKTAWLNAYSSEVPKSGDFEKLYIDGDWLQAQLSKPVKPDAIAEIQQAVLSGKPCAVFGGNVYLSDIVGGTFIEEKTTQPILANAVKVYPDTKVGNRTVTDQLFVVGSSVTSEEASSIVDDWTSARISNETSMALKDSLPETEGPSVSSDPIIQPVPSGSSSKGNPAWSSVGNDTWCYVDNPYGIFWCINLWYQLINDGSNTYDWFNLVMQTISEPGYCLSSLQNFKGSNWRTSDVWTSVGADYYGDPNLLGFYGPGNYSSATNVIYSIGVSNGVDGARCNSFIVENYNCSTEGVPIQCLSSEQVAKWWFNIDEQGISGETPFLAQPGATIRVVPDAPTRVYNSYQVKYAQPDSILGWSYPDTWSDNETIETTLAYPRSINVYVVKPSDSQSSWVGDESNVESGVLSAIEDAQTNTLVTLAGEQFNIYNVTSVSDLYALAQNPPIHAVVVDTAGEVVPMPNQYFGPSVYISSPSDGSTSSYPPTVYANVQPPPSCSLDYAPNGQPGYVYYMWVCQSTGANSGWMSMSPIGGGNYSSAGGIGIGFAFGSYTIYVGASANGIWTIAYITFNYVYENEGGGCPYVNTWSGSRFVTDNNILPASEYSKGTDVTDYYKLQQPLVPNNNGTYALTISELEQEQSFFDQVELLTVDHTPDVNVGVSPYGEILTYTKPYPAVSAIDSSNRNVTALLDSIDGRCYQGYNGSFVTLNFGHKLNTSQGAKLVIRSVDPVGGQPPERKCPIYVQTMDSWGSWRTVATFYTRADWSTDVINMSRYLPDSRGNLKVRLCFTGDDKVDFVGLDTSPNAAVEVENAQMISAEREAYGLSSAGGNEIQDPTVYQNLLSKDGLYTELTPGYQIEMTFDSPKKENQTDVRDFILVTTGHYLKVNDPARVVAADWQDWFNLLRDNMMNYGWIWTDIVGYSCYYFGNTWYTSQFPNYSLLNDPQQPYQNGMQTFLQKDVSALFYAGHFAELSDDFKATSDGETGFQSTYSSLSLATYKTVSASRPLPYAAGLPIDVLGYVDNSTYDPVTVALAMNNTVLDARSYTGVFIYNGMSAIVNNTATAASNDWFKGYVASAVAIEEARVLITWPAVKTRFIDNQQAGAFAVSIRPAGWGQTYDSYGQYKFVDLIFQIGAQYDLYMGQDYQYESFLTQADIDLSSVSNNVIGYNILTNLCGLDTGGTSTSFMNDFLWWSVAAIAGAIPGVGVVIGPAIGLIPILQSYYEPTIPPPNTDALNHIYANGTNVNPQFQVGRGTVSFLVRIKFYKPTQLGWTPYTFMVRMASWVGTENPDAPLTTLNPRVQDIPYTQDITFDVYW